MLALLMSDYVIGSDNQLRWMTVLIGIAAIFLILALLVGFVMLLHLVLNLKKPANRESEESVPQSAEDNSSEVAAAIAAAVSLCLEKEAEESGESAPAFRIRSIRKRV